MTERDAAAKRLQTAIEKAVRPAVASALNRTDEQRHLENEIDALAKDKDFSKKHLLILERLFHAIEKANAAALKGQNA